MKIINADNLDVILNNSTYLTDISMKSDKIYKIVTEANLTEAQEKELINLLNKINNQGIEWIDTANYKYSIKGKKLLMSSMSTAEALFTLAYIASLGPIERYFYKDIKELTKKSKELFFSYFKENPYINAIAEDSIVEYTYNEYLDQKEEYVKCQ